MLQMGFVDDIEWILEQTPAERQIALFSATMPPAIRRIAQKHMRDPRADHDPEPAGTTPKIRAALLVRQWHCTSWTRSPACSKSSASSAMLVFVRTKLETSRSRGAPRSARLQRRRAERGHSPAAARERTIARLKNGQLDIVIATDVAARGLDVERISHVVNYDIPYDSETYVHRIGGHGARRA